MSAFFNTASKILLLLISGTWASFTETLLIKTSLISWQTTKLVSKQLRRTQRFGKDMPVNLKMLKGSSFKKSMRLKLQPASMSAQLTLKLVTKSNIQ